MVRCVRSLLLPVFFLCMCVCVRVASVSVPLLRSLLLAASVSRLPARFRQRIQSDFRLSEDYGKLHRRQAHRQNQISVIHATDDTCGRTNLPLHWLCKPDRIGFIPKSRERRIMDVIMVGPRMLCVDNGKKQRKIGKTETVKNEGI